MLLSVIFLSGCSSVREKLSGGKQSNTDEFLVKKKNPLVLPPSFGDLPKPQNEKTLDKTENDNIDFSSVLGKSKNKKQIKIKKNNSLEKSISKILNSN